MPAIDQIKGHFSRHQVRVIEVPEWADAEDKPLIIYVQPLTLAEKAKLSGYADTTSHIEVLAYTLILKADDAQGNKLFTIEHKHGLMHSADPDVLARVVREMTRPRTAEEMEKNSKPIRSSTSATS